MQIDNGGVGIYASCDMDLESLDIAGVDGVWAESKREG